MGMLKPKSALYGIIICSGFIDLFKRFMVSFGNPNQLDVAYIQSLPLALLVGAIITTLVKLIIFRDPMLKNLITPLWFSFVFALIGVVSAMMAEGGGLRGIQHSANFATYPFLLVILPVWFRNVDELRNMLYFILITFVPVALYMFRHHFFGLADFEYQYLMTGLSQEARILWENAGALRGFSTMNGAGTVSTILSTFLLLCFATMPNATKNEDFMSKLFRLIWLPVFILASYFTVSRGGWFCGLVAVSTYYLFANRSTTILSYLLGAFMFFTLVATAPYIKDHKLLEKLEISLRSVIKADNEYSDRALTLGTAADRLSGLANLTTMEGLWTPLGWKAQGEAVKLRNMKLAAQKGDFSIGHDIIIDTILNYGFVGLSVAVALTCFILYKVHHFLLSLPRRSIEENIVRLCVSLALGISFGALGNAAQMRVFPLSFYIWLFFAISFTIFIWNKSNVIALNNKTSQSGN
jgi:hypothetical protein